MAYLSVIEEFHRGGLGPLGLSRLEKKYIFFSRKFFCFSDLPPTADSLCVLILCIAVLSRHATLTRSKYSFFRAGNTFLVYKEFSVNFVQGKK